MNDTQASINGIISTWIIHCETFEEKINKMEMDKFKKNYPIFSNIERVIDLVKPKNRIYSNEIMKIIGFNTNI